jgi:uncharacterized membrane protein
VRWHPNPWSFRYRSRHSPHRGHGNYCCSSCRTAATGVVVVVVVAVWHGVPVHQKRSAPMVACAQRRMQWGSQ